MREIIVVSVTMGKIKLTHLPKLL